MPACPNCGQENPEGFRFCGSCGAPLEAVETPREVRKTVTVLFCDVTGSTALGERLDPESLRRVMGRYFDEARHVLERHSGTVEKFIGDAVMAVFGVPVLHEDDALRAVRAAFELKEAMAQLNEQLERDYGVTIEIRTGVNTGEVVAGDVAAGQKLVTGDAVNVAARLEQAAQPGDVLIGAGTHALVRNAVEVEELEPLDLKGKGDAVSALRLLGVRSEAPARGRHLESPMVGRDRELALLAQAFDRAVEDRSCQLFTVLGPAGVGKSKLLREFTESLGGAAAVLVGRCLSYGEGITFWPLVEVVRSLTGGDVVSAIAARLGGGEEGRLVAERVAGAIGVTLTSAGGEETFWAVRKLFEAHARERPLVVVFDDVQWAEPTFLDLVEHITDLSRDAPILLVCMARPELLELRPAWGGGKLNATTILLEPLAGDECVVLIENLLGRAELAESARTRIAEAAEGNPLFVEEMLEMLMDDGLLRREDGRWAATGDLESVAVPPSIQALLSARLDRLEPEQRDLIRLAAVEGRLFHLGALETLIGHAERSHVPGQLIALVRKELIRPDAPEIPGDEAFRFRHQLIRDAAYESLPKEARAQAHERFAGWLEEVAGDRAEYVEILGYHLEQAYRYRTELAPPDAASRELADGAAERLATAGKRALVNGDRPGAINLLRRAADLLPERDERRTLMLLDLGEALIEKGDLVQGEDVFAEAVENARTNAQRPLELRATLEQKQARVFVDPSAFDEFRQAVDAAIPELEQLADDTSLAKGWAMVAWMNLMLLQVGKMDDALARSIDYSRRAADRSQEIDSTMWLLRTSWFGPRPVNEAFLLCDEVLARPGLEPGLKSVALQVRGCMYGMLGEFEEGRELIHRAREMQVELGMMIAAGAGSAMMGAGLELFADDPVAAEEKARWGYGVLESMGETGYLSTLAGMLAEALYRQGRFEEAEEQVRAAVELSAPEDLETQRLAMTVKAKILAQRGTFDEAERLGREAVALVDHSDSAFKGDTRLSLAEVLTLADRKSEAAELAREAISLFEEKGLTAGVRQAEAHLAQLD